MSIEYISLILDFRKNTSICTILRISIFCVFKIKYKNTKIAKLVSIKTSAIGFMMSNYFMMSVNKILSFCLRTLVQATMDLRKLGCLKQLLKSMCEFD